MKGVTLSICVATSAVSPEESETFIWAHIKRLPAVVHVLYNGFHPDKYGDGKPVRSRLKRFSYGILNRLSFPGFEDTYSRGIAAFLKRMGIKAVLAEYGPMGLTLMEGCRRAGVPLVVHFHGYDVYRQDVLSWARGQYLQLFKNANALVAVSRNMEKQLYELGAPAEKIKYNPCGVDTSMFQPGKPSEAPPFLLTIGRFVEKKAPNLVVSAFAEVLKQAPDAHLVMIGDGPLWESCCQQIQSLNIGSSVEMTGKLPHEEVAARLAGSRVFVQHSITAADGDREGTPVSVMEASAAGLPVVATQHEGIKEAVVDGVTGFLVDEGDVDGMVKRITQLLHDSELSEKMGSAGRQHIQNEFEIEKRIESLWGIIRQAIENRGFAPEQPVLHNTGRKRK